MTRNQPPLTLTLTGQRRDGRYRAVAFGHDAWLTNTNLETLLALVRVFLSAPNRTARYDPMAICRLRRALGDKKPFRLVPWFEDDEYMLAPDAQLTLEPSFRTLQPKDPLLRRLKGAVLRAATRRSNCQ